MKRLYLILSCVLCTLTISAQTVGEVFYIYRNDGNFNAFFREEIDSIVYSCYDVDSTLYDDIVTQVVFTEDSVYRIPLEAIDSVSFVQPRTIYRENAVPLNGRLLDYLIDVNGYKLTFDIMLPVELTPSVGDKLVATEITDKLPFGFVGIARQISTNFEGIVVSCDSIGLADAVSQFYGVIKIGADKDAHVKNLVPHKASHTSSQTYDLPFGKITLPPMDISGVLSEENSFDIKAKNTLDITYTPQVTVKITRVIDDIKFLSHTNVNVVSNVDATYELDVAGEVIKEWKKSYLPKQEYPIPYLAGYPLYFDIGGRISISGEIAAGFTINASVKQITDITLYDNLLGLIVGKRTNLVDGSISLTHFDMDWNYLGVRANLTLTPLYLRVGLPVGSHTVAWAGGEFEAGLKGDAELMFDIRRIRNAEPGTAVYDELKELAKLEIKPYLGANFMASLNDDRYTIKLGKSFEEPQWTWFQGRPLPSFSNTEATPIGSSTTLIKADITNDCPIPYTIGFAVYDEDGNRASDPVYYQHKFWTRNDFPSYSVKVMGLERGKKYKVYPVIRWFDKFDMLCSPSTVFNMNFPVTLSDFTVTQSQYKKDGFTHEGQTYDYRFDVSLTATLDVDDLSKVEDWGYAYLDPNGREAMISLKEFGTTYTDTRYAYFRNEAHSSCRLYGYVKYIDSDEIVYGETHDYELDYVELDAAVKAGLCPDNHHPHKIDLGYIDYSETGAEEHLLWSCCNLGAKSPEEYGNYYAWGETKNKSVYSWETYVHNYSGNDTPYSWDIRYLDNISGTSYDAARANWGSSWHMFTEYDIMFLLNECEGSSMILNGVKGYKFTGPNGNSIFLPYAGYYNDNEILDAGVRGFYWRDEIHEGNWNAYCLSFNYGGSYSSYVRYDVTKSRKSGLPIRPITILK